MTHIYTSALSHMQQCNRNHVSCTTKENWESRKSIKNFFEQKPRASTWQNQARNAQPFDLIFIFLFFIFSYGVSSTIIRINRKKYFAFLYAILCICICMWVGRWQSSDEFHAPNHLINCAWTNGTNNKYSMMYSITVAEKTVHFFIFLFQSQERRQQASTNKLSAPRQVFVWNSF